MNNLVDADTGTLYDGLDIALKMTNGYLEECSRTPRCSIDGLNLVEVGWPLDSSFPEVFQKFPQVLTCCHMLR